MLQNRWKWLLMGLGALMVVGALVWSITGGINLLKIVIALAGLALLSVVWLGNKAAELYRGLALVLLNTLVFLILLELVAGFALRLLPRSEAVADERLSLSYYQNAEWGEAYWREYSRASREIYTPYVIWSKPPFTGELINVDERGFRFTPGAQCEAGAFTVFTFGGSTMWGDGVPDWGTIAAYVQSELDAQRSTPVCVVNMGQTAWVSTQEVIELVRQLQTGSVPDLVIFYNGGNDVGAAWEFGKAGIHFNMTNISSRFERRNIPNPLTSLLTNTNIFKLFERIVPTLSRIRSDFVADVKVEFDDTAMASEIIEAYLANYRTVKALAQEYGFDYAFFWQPFLLYGEKPLTDEEKDIAARYNERLPGLADLLEVVYPQMREIAEETEQLYYLADVLAEETDSLYVDEIHLTHAGNEIMAKRIIALLNTAQ